MNMLWSIVLFFRYVTDTDASWRLWNISNAKIVSTPSYRRSNSEILIWKGPDSNSYSSSLSLEQMRSDLPPFFFRVVNAFFMYFTLVFFRGGGGGWVVTGFRDSGAGCSTSKISFFFPPPLLPPKKKNKVLEQGQFVFFKCLKQGKC